MCSGNSRWTTSSTYTLGRSSSDTVLVKLPDLGVGLVHLPGLRALLDGLSSPPDVIEIEPQAYWSHSGTHNCFEPNLALMKEAVGRAIPALVHSVGYPIGGVGDGDERQVAALRATLACLNPPWWSDHASFVWAGTKCEQRHLGFLMPPVQSAESIGVIADRIKRLQDLFGFPFAFETGVNYLKPLKGEWPDGAFWGAIADQADCGILFDLHNIWANQINGRGSLSDVLSELPLDRVWEMHVAGGQSHNGFWLDSHSGLPPDGLLDAAANVVPMLPNLHAIILEIIPDYIPASQITADDVSSCLTTLRGIWRTRGRARATNRRSTQTTLGRINYEPPSMAAWERALERALHPTRRDVLFDDDPGIPVYQDLIAMARRGMIVEALPLTLRYLVAVCGIPELDDVFKRFWGRTSVRPFISDEACAFANFVRLQVSHAHLDEVIDFELAAHRATITRSSQFVEFTCEPEALFRSLFADGTSLDIRPTRVRVEVTPPSRDEPAYG